MRNDEFQDWIDDWQRSMGDIGWGQFYWPEDYPEDLIEQFLASIYEERGEGNGYN